jgi:hypothetical protein
VKKITDIGIAFIHQGYELWEMLVIFANGFGRIVAFLTACLQVTCNFF